MVPVMLRTFAGTRRVAHPPAERPILIFDGACEFCQRWARRWRARAGDHFDIEPARTAAGRFPEIAGAEFERAVQFIDTDGQVFTGAEAVLRARARTASRSRLLAAYERLPGAASAAEAVYRLVARHRSLLSWLMRLLRP